MNNQPKFINKIFCIFVLFFVQTKIILADEVTSDTSILRNASDFIQEGLDFLVPTIPGTKIKLGIAMGLLPPYRGSRDYNFTLLPIIDIRYKRRLRLSFDQVTYAAYYDDKIEAGLLIKHQAGRNEDKNPLLKGLGNVNSSFQVGGFVKYKFKAGQVDFAYRKSLNSQYGSSMKLIVGHGIFKKDKFTLAAAVMGVWFSKKAMQTFYGLTEEQSADSVLGLPVFTANAGVSKVDMNILGIYQLSDRVQAIGLMSFGKRFGSAKASPLVAEGRGNSNHFLVGGAITINF